MSKLHARFVHESRWQSLKILDTKENLLMFKQFVCKLLIIQTNVLIWNNISIEHHQTFHWKYFDNKYLLQQLNYILYIT